MTGQDKFIVIVRALFNKVYKILCIEQGSYLYIK